MSTNCTSCPLSGGNQTYLDESNSTCVLTCTLNYLNSSGSFFCDKCDIACLHCTSANSSTDCTSCNEAGGYNFEKNSTSSCVLGCPDGEYVTGTPLICADCDANCLTCSVLSTNCTSCPIVGGNQTYLDSSNNSCVTTCSQSYLTNASLSQCDQCDPACLTCTSANSSTSCASCNEAGGYNFENNSTSSCVLGCPLG